jgi:sugar lactone lactonase YvrE
MTRTPRSVVLLVATALACSCRTTAPPAAASAGAAADPSSASSSAPESSADPGVAFVRAWEANRNGEPERAMALLREVDEQAWSIPMDPKDFPGLSERPEWREIAGRAAAREPRTARAQVAFTLPERGLVAEGIASDPETGALYVSSIRGRKILRVGADGAAAELVSAGGGGLLAPLGLKVDRRRSLLWVAANASPAMVGWEPSMRGRSGLFAFDLESGELRRSAFLSGGPHLLNDVAVAEDGTVFVTDSEGGLVHRLDPDATELRPATAGGFFYPNGIVIAGEHVIFAHAFGLHAFPAAGGDAVPVAGPRGFPLGGFDGLAIDGDAIFGVQNGLGTPRIVRLELDLAAPRVSSAAVIETANPAWRVPTTGALSRGKLFYIANSHVDALGEAGVGPAAMVETTVLALPAR